MTEVRPLSPTEPGVRALTADEVAHLDRARAHLRASGVDVGDVHAVGGLLHSSRSRWAAGPAAPVPAAMVMALGVGVGDLVVARVPGARWALRVGAQAPTPAVVSASGDDAALPLTDVGTRWQTGCGPEWVAEYVAAAAAHLAAGVVAPVVPTPRSPERTDPLAPVPTAAAAPAPEPRSFRTPADLPHPPTPAAQDIALGALDHALELAVSEPAVGSVAFVDGGRTGGHEVRRFADPAARDARDWVRATGAARAAVAWVGRLPGDDAGHAVLVEASDAGEPSLVVAHRWTKAVADGVGRPRPARAVGEPVVLGQGAPLL